MSDIIHMTAANTVEMLKKARSKTRPSEAAVIAGKREPYHLTYIKKYEHGKQKSFTGQAADGERNSIYESDSKVSRK